MEKKWYLHTWIICAMFAFWFFIIPALIGALLLFLKYKEDQRNTETVEQLQFDLTSAQSLLTPEMQDAHELDKRINSLKQQESTLQTNIDDLNAQITLLTDKKAKKIAALDKEISKRNEKIIVLDEEILVQEFGLYKPTYDFCNSEEYNERLKQVRDQQKKLIKTGNAASGNMAWTVNGNATKGRKMVKDMQKLLLRAFNSECDALVSKVKYNNFDTYLSRMQKSREAISKLGQIMSISISRAYYDAKVDELHLALEYQIKKQEEKEAAKEARAEMREAARVQKELEEKRKQIIKEQSHYKNALASLLKQIESTDSPSQDMLTKKETIENHLNNINTSLQDLDYRQINQRAGYVYVISNIGAFGPDIYKIGMTRRLDPQERVDELGDASVPFNFDVHAMIFSKDAPALEAALHRAFDDRKLNMINKRREFFHVTLDEIKEVVRQNYDKTVEFVDIPDASQYRESLKIKEAM